MFECSTGNIEIIKNPDAFFKESDDNKNEIIFSNLLGKHINMNTNSVTLYHVNSRIREIYIIIICYMDMYSTCKNMKKKKKKTLNKLLCGQ